MPSHRDAAELPVLLMYNLDTEWERADKEYQLTEMELMASSLKGMGHPVSSLEINGGDLHQGLSNYGSNDWIVMNLCEEVPGIPHSEAAVAQVLEELDMTYTGSPPEILANSENKRLVKRVLVSRGLPTPLWRVYDTSSAPDWDCFPAIVKSANEHCSMGISSESVVLNREELERQIEFINDSFNKPALVEDFIDGREFHVSLIGNGSLLMLPPVEMDFSACSDIHDRLCTYDSKFIPGSKHYEIIGSIIPASLSEWEYSELRRVCFGSFRAFECRDYARLDIRLRDGIFYILDINPNPDISSDASMACAAEHLGFSYGELGSRLIRLAASRHPLLG